MGHSVDIPYLFKDNIETYLEYLAKEIKNAEIGKHKILVVGGAAMALKYHGERSTVDIDICFREQNNLYKCCEKVGKDNNLPEDWINADVMHSDSFSYRLFDNAVFYKNIGDELEIYVVDDLDLYCMKVVSFRPKDIQDMIRIAPILKENDVNVDVVKSNFERLYGNLYHFLNDKRKEQLVSMQLK